MIGRAVAHALSTAQDLIATSRKSRELHVDMPDPASLRALFAKTATLDAIISVAGDGVMAALATMGDADFDRTLNGQLNSTCGANLGVAVTLAVQGNLLDGPGVPPGRSVCSRQRLCQSMILPRLRCCMSRRSGTWARYPWERRY